MESKLGQNTFSVAKFQTDADASVDLEDALPPRSASADELLASVASGLRLQQHSASLASHHSSKPIRMIPRQMLSTSRLSDAPVISSAAKEKVKIKRQRAGNK